MLTDVSPKTGTGLFANDDIVSEGPLLTLCMVLLGFALLTPTYGSALA